MKLSDRFIWIIIIILNLVLVYLNQSTFDSGDSVLHYVESHQAWQTPHYFMDMWSKPLFILLSSPLASLGWYGMKLFNSICILLSAFYTKKIFEYFRLNGWWGVFISFFAYSFFLVQSSGLTEPLFTLGLTAIVYYYLIDRYLLASSILSFLPFVRSEGYIIGVIILVYLVVSKKYKAIPILALGTFVYGIVGLFVFEDFLWMFHQNPYSGIEEKYGSGDALHFFIQLPYVIGLPIFLLAFLGGYHAILRLFKGNLQTKEFYLIFGIAVGYIVAHSIFWRYGLFHSYGLTRVLIVIIPLIAFIAYRGKEWISCAFHFVPKTYIDGLLVLVIIIFPFIPNKMAMDLPEDIQLSEQQILIESAHEYIVENNLEDIGLYTNAFYYTLKSEKIIDNDQEINTLALLKNKDYKPTPGKLVLWDSYFAPSDAEITQRGLESNYDVEPIKQFENEQGYKLILYKIN